MPITSEAAAAELLNDIEPEALVLPITLPVTLPIFANPDATNIPINGAEVLVPETAPVTEIAVTVLP
jgi:hypothetical protein